VHNGKPSIVVRDLARYYRVDAGERAAAGRVEPAGRWPLLLRWPAAGWPGATRGAARHGDRRRRVAPGGH
jgi:hypothetical protein